MHNLLNKLTFFWEMCRNFWPSTYWPKSTKLLEKEKSQEPIDPLDRAALEGLRYSADPLDQLVFKSITKHLFNNSKFKHWAETEGIQVVFFTYDSLVALESNLDLHPVIISFVGKKPMKSIGMTIGEFELEDAQAVAEKYALLGYKNRPVLTCSE